MTTMMMTIVIKLSQPHTTNKYFQVGPLAAGGSNVDVEVIKFVANMARVCPSVHWGLCELFFSIGTSFGKVELVIGTKFGQSVPLLGWIGANLELCGADQQWKRTQARLRANFANFATVSVCAEHSFPPPNTPNAFGIVILTICFRITVKSKTRRIRPLFHLKWFSQSFLDSIRPNKRSFMAGYI